MKIQLPQIMLTNKDHIEQLYNCSRMARDQGDYEIATNHALEIAEAAKNSSGYMSAEYAIIMNYMGDLYHEAGHFEAALNYYEEALSIRMQLYGDANPVYIETLNDKALVYRSLGMYDQAADLLVEVINLTKKNLGSIHTLCAYSTHNLATIYLKKGDYIKAEPLFRGAHEIFKTTIGKSQIDYAASLNDMAYFCRLSGKYSECEAFYVEAMSVAKNLLDPAQPEFQVYPSNLAALYITMGRYAEAEPLLVMALQVRKTGLPPNSPDTTVSMHNLAALYLKMRRWQQAQELFQEALVSTEKALGKNHRDYADTLDNLSLLYETLGNYPEAEMATREALEIRINTIGKDHPDTARSLNNLALLCLLIDRFEDAESIFADVLVLREKLLGKHHTDYAETLNHLGSLYLATDRPHLAEQYFSAAVEIYSKQLSITYPLLSEKEKYQFLSTIQPNLEIYFSFVFDIVPAGREHAFATDLQHLICMTKANILSLTRQLKTTVINTGNQELLDCYGEFIINRKKLAHIYTLSNEERQNQRINLAELEKITNESEKNLATKFTAFSSIPIPESISWENIRGRLEDGEAVIDFFHFRYYNRKWTGERQYFALVSRKEYKTPILVRLCTEQELNCVMDLPFKMSYIFDQDIACQLYALVWKPLTTYLDGVSDIFLSASGLLSRLSFGVLMWDNGHIHSRQYHIRYVNNIHDIITLKKNSRSQTNERTAAIFGGAFYNGGSNEANEPFTYLKGTQTEAEKITSLLEDHDFRVSAFTGMQATEQAIKKLNRANSPFILHIATHGYFFPEPENSTDVIQNTGHPDHIFVEAEQPLLRSGLALTGANLAWSGKIPIDQSEDGILTAYEISDLDLPNTELAVLSACETGLGDIRGTEGVFGLQRAFKVAGAMSVMMSLWKVPDRITGELMSSFYNHWLQGKTKSEALRAAQAEIRKSKESPFFWAAFILVE